jgi:hypothetical protein
VNIKWDNIRNINKCGLFSWPLHRIYTFLWPAVLKFESFKIKETSMADVEIEPHLEAKVELWFNQEMGRTVNSETSFCVSVGTQCEQTTDEESIVVMKFTCSDDEDAVAGEEDSQLVSIAYYYYYYYYYIIIIIIVLLIVH